MKIHFFDFFMATLRLVLDEGNSQEEEQNEEDQDGDGIIEQKKKRKSIMTGFKLRAIDYWEEKDENGQPLHSLKETARKFDVTENMIRYWKKTEEILRSVPKTKRSVRSGKPRWPELESKLKKWIKKERDDKRQVKFKKNRFSLKGQCHLRIYDDTVPLKSFRLRQFRFESKPKELRKKMESLISKVVSIGFISS